MPVNQQISPDRRLDDARISTSTAARDIKPQKASRSERKAAREQSKASQCETWDEMSESRYKIHALFDIFQVAVITWYDSMTGCLAISTMRMA